MGKTQEGTRRERRAVIFGPGATPEEMAAALERNRKQAQDLNDYFTIAFSSDSENRFREAKKAVYGKDGEVDHENIDQRITNETESRET
jgi:hypothetical protein